MISRPFFEIKRGLWKLLGNSNVIELAGDSESEDIANEINIVIKDRVAKINEENFLSSRIADHLEKRLLETKDRTYLWLHLIWNIIEESLSDTVTAINELIDDLPSGITDSYETLLQRCPNRLFARRVLEIILVARQPLTLDEIDLALGLSKDVLSYDNLELEGSFRLQETLSSRCGLMISIIQSKVYFIHHTVKEFLLRRDDADPPVDRIWQQSIDPRHSHSLMLKVCLKSIAFSGIRWDRANIHGALLPEDDREMEPNPYCQMFVLCHRSHFFLFYSAIYWADNYGEQQKRKDVETIETILQYDDDIPVKGRENRFTAHYCMLPQREAMRKLSRSC